MSSTKSETESGFVDNWQSRKSITTCNLHMLTSKDSCDVSFKVGPTQSLVRAHRYVLISRSCVFHSMLCGDLAGTGDVTIPDVEENIFREMLKYLYIGECDIDELNVTGLLYLSKKYAVGGLEDNCVSFLDKKLNPQNACVIMEQAHLFDEKELQDKALKIILKNGNVCLQGDEFKSVCEECFHKIMRSDSLNVKPGIMFSAALSWARHELERQGREVTPDNTRDILGKSLYSITFTSMEQEEFAQTVVPSEILTGKETTSLLCHFILPKTDIDPFRVKAETAKIDVGSMKFTRLSLYDLHIPLAVEVDQTGIEITCDEDVTLYGLILFGLNRATDLIYSVSIRRYRKHFTVDMYGRRTPRFEWIEDGSEVLWDQVKGQPMKSEYHDIKLELPQPYLMTEGLKHSVTVGLQANGLTIYCGQNLRSSFDVSGCNINLSQNAGDCGLISQLIVLPASNM